MRPTLTSQYGPIQHADARHHICPNHTPIEWQVDVVNVAITVQTAMA